MNDLFQKMLFVQYEQVEVYDVKATFARPLKQDPVLRELNSAGGVQKVQPVAEVPVTLKHKWRQKDVTVIGILAHSTLYNILDQDENRVNLPRSGILLSERLAELLDARVGTSSALLLALPVTAVSIWIAQRAAARKISGFNISEVLRSGG